MIELSQRHFVEKKLVENSTSVNTWGAGQSEKIQILKSHLLSFSLQVVSDWYLAQLHYFTNTVQNSQSQISGLEFEDIWFNPSQLFMRTPYHLNYYFYLFF